MSTSLSLTERLKRRKPQNVTVLDEITSNECNGKRSGQKKRECEKTKTHVVPNIKKRRTSARTNKTIEPFTYCNWLDDSFVKQHTINNSNNNNSNVKTWMDFVTAIGEQNKKRFPIVEQQKNDCTVMSAISAYEVQNRKKWDKDVSKIGAIKQTIENGAHLEDVIPRIWGSSNPLQPHNVGRLYGVEQLSKLVSQGPVYCGIEELGYPWANSASKTKHCRKERFIPPRFDPYNNPWEPSRKSGADGHAIVIVGKFYCHDKFTDGVNRNKNQVIGNCFVTKCTVIPAGWGYRPMWTKKIDGVTYTRDEFSYALLPIDLLTDPIRTGEFHRRQLNDVYRVQMNI